MLLQFAVQNFLSIHDKVVLSALADESVAHRPGQLIDGPGGLKVLRVIALYGANAAGKSNVLKALEFARERVVTGLGAHAPIPTRPFRFATDATSTFEFEFVVDGIHHSYGFELSQARVESEWLLVHRAGEETLVCERTAATTPGEAPSLEIGPALEGAANEVEILRVIAATVRENQLLLQEAEGRRVKVLDRVAGWFRDGVAIRGQEVSIETDLLGALSESEELLGFCSRLLSEAGTGVAEVRVEKPNPPDNDAIAPTQIKIINTKKSEKRQEMALRIAREWTGKLAQPRLVFHHTPPNANILPFSTDEESDGTLQLLNLSPLLYALTHPDDALQVACVDELDRSLHPNLSRFVLQAVLEASPRSAGQLIFATHDTNLLDLNLLSPDSIWFVEKKTTGASHLYALSEFKPDQLEHLKSGLEEGYLQGRFGAVPFLGDPRRLGWIAKDEGDGTSEAS